MHRERDSILQALMQGYHDRAAYGLLRVEQLYRKPVSLRVAWRLGWEVANFVSRTPVRTKSKAHHPPPPPPN